MSHFTPAPWIWFYRDWIYQEHTNESVLIADDRGQLMISDEDATLIAKAPELFVALGELVAELNETVATGVFSKELSDALRQAELALDEATFREPGHVSQ